MWGLGDSSYYLAHIRKDVGFNFKCSCCDMSKKKNYTLKIVGTISKKIAQKNNVSEYSEFEILQSSKLDIHTNKHADDFVSIDSYHKTLIGIDKIIEEPYHVEYDNKRNSFKYYGKVE